MSRSVRAYIGLGSNVGHPEIALARAVAALAELPGARLRGVSRLYATEPVGVRDQPEFRNAVVALDVPAGSDPGSGALDLLRQLKGLEAAFGRTPGRRWGPRVLDLDLLVFGRARLVVERPAELASAGADGPGRGPRDPDVPDLLRVPHRDLGMRLFILAPLADLAAGLVPPGWDETVASARRRRRSVEGPHAARAIADWDRRVGRWTPLDLEPGRDRAMGPPMEAER